MYAPTLITEVFLNTVPQLSCPLVSDGIRGFVCVEATQLLLLNSNNL